jgi:hypothetical protein
VDAHPPNVFAYDKAGLLIEPAWICGTIVENHHDRKITKSAEGRK